MRRHINLGEFLREHPYLEEIETNKGTVLLMNLWKVGIIHNYGELVAVMEKLAEKLNNRYFDGRVYTIEANGDKIVIKCKF